tara:strand:+ start:203 stop:544 length:342 start_codon:yes stop_codon:yes gene_type:complete
MNFNIELKINKDFMKFFILRFFLGFIGFFFLTIFLFSLYNLIELLYFSEKEIINKLFDSNSECEESNLNSKKDYCFLIASSYWMITIVSTSFILSFITLFPFFSISKKKKKNC